MANATPFVAQTMSQPNAVRPGSEPCWKRILRAGKLQPNCSLSLREPGLTEALGGPPLHGVAESDTTDEHFISFQLMFNALHAYLSIHVLLLVSLCSPTLYSGYCLTTTVRK